MSCISPDCIPKVACARIELLLDLNSSAADDDGDDGNMHCYTLLQRFHMAA